MKLYLRIVLLSISFISIFLTASAQKTVVLGVVSEASSGSKVPYANVYFKSSTEGTVTDTNGYFHLTTTHSYDSLVVSVLGYQKMILPIVKGKTQTINFSIKSNIFDLTEVVINPGENPAWAVLRKAIENKSINSPEAKPSYQYEEYSKIQFDLNHFTEKIKENFILKPFDLLWEHIDSTDDGIAYLPVLIIENITEHYYEKDGNKSKEVVIAHRTTGLEGPRIREFVSDMYMQPNLYDNWIGLLERNFPGPLNDNYKAHYKYYLNDSVIKNDELYYLISFKPKSFNAAAFEGHMLIHKGSYAIKEISVRFDVRANVNFVRSYYTKQTYEPNDAGFWMLSASHMIGDFTVLENQTEMTGFFGRKSTSIKNLKIGVQIPDSVFQGIDRKVAVKGSDSRTDEYWHANRHQLLNKEEQDIYKMIADLKDHPKFIFRKNLVQVLTDGYYPKKYIDVGNIATFLNYNQVEYARIKVGMRLSKKRFENTLLKGYVAYGDRDSKFKYSVDAAQTFKGNRNRFLRVGGSYQYDIEQLGWSYNSLPIDHMFNSFMVISVSRTRTYNERYKAFIERQWFTGLNTRVGIFTHEVTPTADLHFLVNDSAGLNQVQGFNIGGGEIDLRFQQGEDETTGEYNSPTHRSKFDRIPIISIQYKFGQKDILNSQFDFQSINIRLDHRIKYKKWGYTRYLIEAGKIWGTMPYHFLHNPFGNEMLFNDEIVFNLMNYLEFINDEFVQVQLEHHFQGLLLGLLPGMKDTKLRSFVFGKMIAGDIRQENFSDQYLFPIGSTRLTEPYFELGCGVENILKIARVDFIWRLNYLDRPNVYPILIKPSFRINF